MQVNTHMRRMAQTSVAQAALLVLITGLAGCSLFRGTAKPGDDAAIPSSAQKKAGDAKADVVSAADAGATANAASSEPVAVAKAKTDAEATAASDAERAKTGLRKIAILPVAYSAGGAGYTCELCPASVTMQPTGAEAARLVSAFFYENMARHPRFLTVRYETVAAVASKGMRAAAADLASRGKADAVLVAALVALRARVGDDETPERPAGAVLFASLVDARSGAVLWSGTFDEDDKPKGRLHRLYDRIVGGVPRKWSSAEGFTEVGVKQLVEDMVDEIDD